MHDNLQNARARTRRWLAVPENAKRHKQKSKERIEEKQKWIAAYLRSHPCVDCGETDIVVLQFDHIAGDKKYDVTGLTSRSLDMIQLEIRKCDVVCANDHARRTAQRANTIRWQVRN